MEIDAEVAEVVAILVFGLIRWWSQLRHLDQDGIRKDRCAMDMVRVMLVDGLCWPI
jgi:hypothetical protein